MGQNWKPGGRCGDPAGLTLSRAGSTLSGTAQALRTAAPGAPPGLQVRPELQETSSESLRSHPHEKQHFSLGSPDFYPKSHCSLSDQTSVSKVPFYKSLKKNHFLKNCKCTGKSPIYIISWLCCFMQNDV